MKNEIDMKNELEGDITYTVITPLALDIPVDMQSIDELYLLPVEFISLDDAKQLLA